MLSIWHRCRPHHVAKIDLRGRVATRPSFGRVHVADISSRRPLNHRQLDPGIKEGRGRRIIGWNGRDRALRGYLKQPKLAAPDGAPALMLQ